MPVDYRAIKAECEDKIMRLEVKLAEAATNTTATVSIDKLVDKAVSTFTVRYYIFSSRRIKEARDNKSDIP